MMMGLYCLLCAWRLLVVLSAVSFVLLGLSCCCVAGGCPCVEQIVVGGADLFVVVARCSVALCSVSLVVETYG